MAVIYVFMCLIGAYFAVLDTRNLENLWNCRKIFSKICGNMDPRLQNCHDISVIWMPKSWIFRHLGVVLIKY